MDNQPQEPLSNSPADNNYYPPNDAGPSAPGQPVSQPAPSPLPQAQQPAVYSPINQPQPVTQPGVTSGSMPSSNNNPVGQNPFQASPISGSAPSPTPKHKSKKPLFAIGLLVVLVIIIGGVTYAMLGQKTSYQSVVQKFITAVQNKDKTTADSLESPAMKSVGQKTVGSSSFYAVCQQAGQLCMPLFSNSFLDKSTKSYKSYTAKNGAKGREVVYSLKQSASPSQAGGQSCGNGSSVSSLTIDVVPNGSSWLVDNVNPALNASANLCLAPGGTSSVGT